MALIALTNGNHAIVDDEDFAALDAFKWHGGGGYARRHVRVNGKRTAILLHREVMSCPQGMTVDHISGDTLDNRRSNLRVCTSAQNLLNRKKHTGGKNLYKGLQRGWGQHAGQFQGCIWLNRVRRRSTWFKTQEEAAQWYDMMAVKLFGEFARTNRSLGLLTA